MSVPESVRGKKVRCKGCGNAIRIPAAAVDTRVRTEQAQAKATADAASMITDDAKNPYGVTETSLSPRCPHCAYELEPPDSRICLHCGYDMVKRQRRPSIVTHEHTGGDWFMWLLPGIACLLAVLAIIGAGIYYHYWLPFDLLKDKDANALLDDRMAVFQKEDTEFLTYMFHPGIEVWFAVMALFLIWKAGKFAFKRLILNFRPPEIVKVK